MLQYLTIQNYTLIEKTTIDINSGFTVITGETGAGKSILLGALALLLGKRADITVLKDPDKKCIVEAVFNLSGLELETFFEDNDLDFELETVIRREIAPTGKSRAFINDTPVGITILKKLGEQLVDIHSQHQTLLLNEKGFQRQLFDAYVNEPELLKNFADVYLEYVQTLRDFKKLQEQNNKAKSDEDYFYFQLNELDSAGLDEEEFKALEEKATLLTHSEEIALAVSGALQVLNENENAVIDRVRELKDQFLRLENVNPGLKDVASRLDGVYIELTDLVGDIEKYMDVVQFDPSERQIIEEKLDEIYRLQQKHHVSDIKALIAVRESFRKSLEQITTLDSQLEEVTKSLHFIEKKLDSLSLEIRNKRNKEIPPFQKEVVAVLQQLGMSNARFEVNIEPLDEFKPWGKDQITFLFSANPGTPLTKIARAASGGELSRLMLALKSLVHQKKLLPTIILDEIDSGVSGDIAGKVGAILQTMAQSIQVLAITHLPQIAGRAKYQFKVSKEVVNKTTHSRITLLNREQRLEEIAKMLSDEKVTDAARKVANELLTD